MSNLKTQLACMIALGASSVAGIVHAQSTTGALNQAAAQSGDFFARDRSVPVRERPRPEYEALGTPVGTFTAFPSVQIDAEYTDNVFAVSNGADGDWIVHVKPEVQLESGWSRHALAAYARADLARYQDFSNENFEDYGVGASGRLDYTRAANLAGGVDYASVTEPRTSSNAPASTREPIQYDLMSGFVAGTRVGGRVKLSGRADLREYDYEDGLTLGGVVVDQDNRDRTISSLTARGDYAISPATAVFAQVTGNKRDYDTATSLLLPARDSDGYEFLAGANFEVGALARGEVAVGYISQTFDSAAYDEISGFGTRAQLEWFPTQLTTVTGTASRTIEDAGIAGSGGYLSSAVGVRVDHELLRNVLLNANLTYSQDEYEGIDRNDDRLQASIGGTYLVNRSLGVSLAASHFEQTSDGAAGGSDFDVNRVSLSLVAQF